MKKSFPILNAFPYDKRKMSKARSKLTETTLIGISGKQYSGKDLLTGLLMARLPEFRQIPLALAIKTAYAQRHGMTIEALEADKARHREGLIALGNEGRTQDPDCWLRQVLSQPGSIIISDIRLKREYDALRAQGAFLIRLDADRSVRMQRGMLTGETDPTETELDDIPEWDAVLVNNTTLDELRRQVDALFDGNAGRNYK